MTSCADDDFVFPDGVDELNREVKSFETNTPPFFKFWPKDANHAKVVEFWDKVYAIVDEHVPHDYAEGFKYSFLIELNICNIFLVTD